LLLGRFISAGFQLVRDGLSSIRRASVLEEYAVIELVFTDISVGQALSALSDIWDGGRGWTPKPDSMEG
jgi:hypothetical protein